VSIRFAGNSCIRMSLRVFHVPRNKVVVKFYNTKHVRRSRVSKLLIGQDRIVVQPRISPLTLSDASSNKDAKKNPEEDLLQQTHVSCNYARTS
jgi:hypothetical protein